MGFIAADLEADFDPSSYDQAMARAFDEDYYELEEEEGWGEGEEEGEEWMPVFSEDEAPLSTLLYRGRVWRLGPVGTLL